MKYLLILFIILFNGCANKVPMYEKFYINNLNIKETESDWNLNFKQNETPFFEITDQNSTIAGLFIFKNNIINGFVFVSNDKNKFNEKKEIFDCDINSSNIKPSYIIKSGELETDITAILINRCFYFK